MIQVRLESFRHHATVPTAAANLRIVPRVNGEHDGQMGFRRWRRESQEAFVHGCGALWRQDGLQVAHGGQVRQWENLVAGEARPKVFSTRHDGMVFVDNKAAHMLIYC